jgi:hypothetical protein
MGTNDSDHAMYVYIISWHLHINALCKHNISLALIATALMTGAQCAHVRPYLYVVIVVNVNALKRKQQRNKTNLSLQLLPPLVNTRKPRDMWPHAASTLSCVAFHFRHRQPKTNKLIIATKDIILIICG